MRVSLNGKEVRKDTELYLEPTIGAQSHDTVHMLSTSLPTPTSTQGTLRPTQPLQDPKQIFRTQDQASVQSSQR
jgi:hypothetical protein